jgi:50S ribosomal protein L16 3-hydroxylase
MTNKTTAPIVARLGRLSTTEFMQTYWQRKPVLIRAAFDQFEAPVSAESVLESALSDAAPSRLIEQKQTKLGKTQWQLTHGPLDRLPSFKKNGWTVLLQAANTQWPELAQVMHRLRFISDARLDDLMVSVASDGGGVGPHLDSYDVFLLQASGQRHWRWGKTKDQQLQADQPVKLLAHFTGGETAVLDPGDMLYLPAGWAHEGIAQGPCMTYSIGFRASTQREIVGEFLARAADNIPQAGRQVRDPARAPTTKPAKIPQEIASDYETLIRRYQPSRRQIKQFVGEHLSEPLANVFFSGPQKPLSMPAFKKKVGHGNLVLHHATRALYDSVSVYLNGDSFVCRDPIVRQFFDQREISANLLRKMDQNYVGLLYEWYCFGWILLK